MHSGFLGAEHWLMRLLECSQLMDGLSQKKKEGQRKNRAPSALASNTCSITRLTVQYPTTSNMTVESYNTYCRLIVTAVYKASFGSRLRHAHMHVMVGLRNTTFELLSMSQAKLILLSSVLPGLPARGRLTSSRLNAILVTPYRAAKPTAPPSSCVHEVLHSRRGI
eukprot:1140518-Pelagomonas_calceolata.AAC.4